MPKKLTKTVVHTKTVSDVKITEVVVNYERGFTEVKYMTMLDDGTPYQRDSIRGDDMSILDPESLYAEVLNKIES